MTEWYTSDHVKQGKRDYAVGGRSLIKDLVMIKVQARTNLRGGFRKMRLTGIIYRSR